MKKGREKRRKKEKKKKKKEEKKEKTQLFCLSLPSPAAEPTADSGQ